MNDTPMNIRLDCPSVRDQSFVHVDTTRIPDQIQVGLTRYRPIRAQEYCSAKKWGAGGKVFLTI